MSSRGLMSGRTLLVSSLEPLFRGLLGLESEQAACVLLEDQRTNLRLYVEFLEIGEPAIGQDGGQVRAEQNTVIEQAVGVFYQDRREVVLRTAATFAVDLWLVRSARHIRLPPGGG